MTRTYEFAKQELDILAATVPDAIVTPFAEEILALCEKFGESGQSGGSAPYTASAIARTVKKLLLKEPICDVTGHKTNSNCMDKETIKTKVEIHEQQVKILYKVEMELVEIISSTGNETLMEKFTEWQTQRTKCNEAYVAMIPKLPII